VGEASEFAAAGGVPHPRHLVEAGGGDARAVGAKGRRVHPAVVSEAGEFAAGGASQARAILSVLAVAIWVPSRLNATPVTQLFVGEAGKFGRVLDRRDRERVLRWFSGCFVAAVGDVEGAFELAVITACPHPCFVRRLQSGVPMVHASPRRASVVDLQADGDGHDGDESRLPRIAGRSLPPPRCWPDEQSGSGGDPVGIDRAGAIGSRANGV